MSKSKLLSTALIAFTALTPLHMANAAPGYKNITLKVAHRQNPLDVHIWYPTSQTGEPTMIGKNAVFKGVAVRPSAKPIEGDHPLVLLSHGSGGNAVNIAWIAAELADRGMVVVAPNHPGTTSNDSHPSETVKLWERPKDLSAIIDKALNGNLGQMKLNPTKIGAVGFSLGGFTALSVAGAKASQEGYISYCKKFVQMHDCKWLQAGAVDFEKIDKTRFEQSNLDQRINTVVAIDPALAQAYNGKSLEGIDMPVMLINLGEGKQVPPGIDASAIASKFTNARLTNIKQGTHFSFLGECTTIGWAIIKAAGEEPICSETGNRPRGEIHLELKQKIGDFLETQFFTN